MGTEDRAGTRTHLRLVPTVGDRQPPLGAGCQLYAPGHRLHHIQVRLALEQHGEGTPAWIVGLFDPDLLVIMTRGIARPFHTHELATLRAELARFGPAVRQYASKGYLHLPGRGIGIAQPERWHPACEPRRRRG